MIDLSKYKNMSELYLDNSSHIVARKAQPVVLKTDLWNEACDSPIVGGIIGNLLDVSQIYAIEICPDRVKKAIGNLRAENYPGKYHFISGDIRSLPYEDKKFDVLLDLSTIDHIVPDDMPKTIEGYARVLKPDGLILLVSWCDDNFRSEKIAEYSPTTQYYHSEKLLVKELEKYFVTTAINVLIKRDGKSLIKFVCSKKGL